MKQLVAYVVFLFLFSSLIMAQETNNQTETEADSELFLILDPDESAVTNETEMDEWLSPDQVFFFSDEATAEEEPPAEEEENFFDREVLEYLYPGFDLLDYNRKLTVTNIYFETNYYVSDEDVTNEVVVTNFLYVQPERFTFAPVTNSIVVTNYQVEAETTNYQVFAYLSNELYLVINYSDDLMITNTELTTNIMYVNDSFDIMINDKIVSDWMDTDEIVFTTNFVFNDGMFASETNMIITNSNIIYQWHDPFPGINPINIAKTPEDLRDIIIESLFPFGTYGIENEEISWMVSAERKLNDELPTDDFLVGVNDDLFNDSLNQKKYNKLIFTPEEEEHLNLGFEQWETKVIISGNVKFTFVKGWVKEDEDNQTHKLTDITKTGTPGQEMNLNVLGKFGDRISVTIDQSSQSWGFTDMENTYEFAFKALDSDITLLRELKAGNVNLTIPDSSYFIGETALSSENYGLYTKLEKNDVTFQALASISISLNGSKSFVGSQRNETVEKNDKDFIKRKYYILPDTDIDSGSVSLYKQTTSEDVYDITIGIGNFVRMVEGVDFSIDLVNGELVLEDSLDASVGLAINYTAGGSLFTTNTNSIVESSVDTGDDYLFLWESGGDFSQYVHCGYYKLGYTDFDPTKGFSILVYKKDETNTSTEIQFTSEDYTIYQDSGILKFDEMFPFAPELYLKANPAEVDSEYKMKVTLYKNVDYYQLDFGVVAGTERVKVNDVAIDENDPTYAYYMFYEVGQLIFLHPENINDTDLIDVTYEYKPFFSTTQNFSLAGRLDWKPSNLFNMGSTMVYNIGQRSAVGAPKITDTSENSFYADVDSNIDVGGLLGLNDDFDFTLKTEAAISVVDANSVDIAIIDDFESSGESMSLTVNDTRWILSAPTTNLAWMNYSNRGKLLYKDYRDYKYDNTFTLQNYSAELTEEQIKEYSFKPGPYLALGGHLSAADYPQLSQTSICFDYDFTDGDWVGAVTTVAGNSSGTDLGEYNQIVIWAKVQSDEDGDGAFSDTGSSEVEIYIAAGTMNEDSDGDGVYDKEVYRTDPGYDFNDALNPDEVATRVGGGRRDGGDGYIQSENLNFNTSLDTNESLVVLPSVTGDYTDVTNVVVSEGDWQKFTINISQLTTEQAAILEHATSVGVYLRQVNGTKGRVVFDSIEFKQVKWEDKIVDGVDADSSPVIEGESIGVYNNTYYSANRFYILNSDDTNVNERAVMYEKLHGPKTISEAEQMDELSLALNYNLTNVEIKTNISYFLGGTAGSLIKESSRSFDISKYRNLGFYIFVPDEEENGSNYKQDGDTYTNEIFVLELASTEDYCFRWEIPLDVVQKNDWNKVVISLDTELSINVGGVDIPGYAQGEMVGFPSMNDINYIRLGIETTSTNEPVNRGQVWVNELFVSEDTVTFGYGFYAEEEFEYDEPLWSVGTFDILGPVQFNTIFEYKNNDFISTSDDDFGVFNNSLSFNYYSELIEYIDYNISYSLTEKGTDTNVDILPEYLQWNDNSQTFSYNVNFDMDNDYVPVLTHTYTETIKDGLSRDYQESTNVGYITRSKLAQNYDNTLSFDISQNMPFDKLFHYGLVPKLSWDEEYSIEDASLYTNDDGEVFMSNDTAIAKEIKSKTMSAALRILLDDYDINASYNKKREYTTEINDEIGLRQEINEITEQSVFERFSERFVSMSEGFYFPGYNAQTVVNDDFILSFDADEPTYLEFMDFSIDTGITRSQSGEDVFNSYEYENDWSLDLGPTESDSKIPQFNFDFERTVDFTPNSVLSNNAIVELEDSLKFGEIFYRNPIYYNILFFGEKARANSLDMVTNFSDIDSGSSLVFSDEFSFEMIVPDFDNLVDYLLPKRYTFTTEQSTTRLQSSIKQKRTDSFSTTFPIEISELFTQSSNAVLTPDDLSATINYDRIVSYNSLTATNTLELTLSETFYWEEDNNFILNYNMKLNTFNYLTNATDYSSDYGLNVTNVNISPFNKHTHTFKVTVNWLTEDVEQIDLWLFKIKLDDSEITHKDIFKASTQFIEKKAEVYDEYSQMLYEFSLDHESDFDITDMISAKLGGEMILNQYAEVNANSGKDKYDPSFGFEVEMEVNIQI